MSPRDGLPNPARRWAFSTIAMALTMVVLDSSLVNVALPAMAKDLRTDAASAIWVINAYQIAVTATLLSFAALGDRLGYKRIYWCGLAVFTAASLACALAQTLPMLVAARIVQGLGGAGVMSVNIALVRFVFPRAMLGRGVAATSLVVAISSAAGPTIAAAILSVASWSWLFLVNLPIGALALVIGARTLPETPRAERSFDWASGVMNALTFGLFIAGLNGFGAGHHRTLALVELAVAAVVGVLFVRRQVAMPAPLLPLDLLRRPVFALSVLSSICSFAAQSITFVALPFYFQDVLGRSEAATGFLMTPWPLALAVMAPLSGRLSDRHSPGLLGGIGLATLCGGLVLLALLPQHPSALDIVWRLTICGLGFGLFQSPNNRLIITSAPPERSGGASGMQSTARLVGQSLGAASAALLFGLGAAHPTTAALWVAAALAFCGTVASSLRRGLAGPS